MKRFLYALATVFSFFSFVLFLYPIVTSLDNLRDGISTWITIGIIGQLAPVAIALAVLPLCLAVAFDMATRDSD